MGRLPRFLLATVAVLSACGPGGRNGDDDPGPDAPGSDSGGTTDLSRVYAHSGDTLYRMNPVTLSPMQIGTMSGLTGQLLDLAVDKSDRIVGASRTELYTISSTSGAAQVLRALDMDAQGFTSLSFIPGASPNDPDILVAANEAGDVFQINESNGSATLLGNYGMHGGMQVKSSGDLFGVRNFGIFATVDVGDGTMDYLARVDPANGWKATPLAQSTNHDKIFGLGFWGGKIYGFVDKGFVNNQPAGGTMIEIDSNTGAATTLASGTERWFGAGVTTNAPIIE
jgi:hypothetical protein